MCIRDRHYTVQAVDGYGNPIYLHEESTPVVLIWGAEGQRLISRIENATLNQVEEALGMNVKDFSSSDILSLIHIFPPSEQYAIILKSNFGAIGNPVWKGFNTIRGSNGKIRLPGHYLLSIIN